MKPKSNHPRRRAMRLRDYDYTQPGAYFVTICVQHRKCLFGTITDGSMQLNEIGQIVVECLNHIPQHFPSVELDAYVVMPNHIHGIIAWGISLPGNPRLPDTIKDRRGGVPSSASHQARIVGAGSPRPSNNRTVTVGAGSPRPSDNKKQNVGAGSPRPSNNRTVTVGAGSPRPSQNTSNRINETSSPSLGKIIAYFKYQSTKHINQRYRTPGTRLWQRNYHDHIIRDDPDLQRLREYIQINPVKWELDQLHPDNPSKW